jgi:branched-chain amino acid transport system substrate-binding protein
MNMKKTLALSSLLLLAACAPAGLKPFEEEPIKIGHLGPLTGDAASYGVDTANATALAIEELNAAGGINGRSLKLISEDSRCNPTDATSAAQKLVNIDKVVAIIGGQCSGETLAAAPIAEANEVVLISPVSSSPDVTKAGDFVFRIYPSDWLKGAAFANYFTEMGFTKVALITENTDFAIGIRTSTREQLPEGAAIVFDEVVNPGTKDFRTLMTRLKDTDFDVFIVNTQTDAAAAAMITQMREQGITQQAIGTDASDSVTLGEIATEAVEGLHVLSVPNLSESGPAQATFAENFRDRYGEAQSTMFFAALAYDATNILAEAIAEVGTDGAAIRDWLYALPGYDGIAGTISFDENGDVEGISYALKVFEGGKLKKVKNIPLD